MAPARQVSEQQLDILVEFAEENKDIALKLHKYGALSQQRANKAWEKVAQTLNSIGDGTTKTADRWKRYWHLLKFRTKAKAADVRRSQSGIGGEPNKMVPLTEIEQRIMRVIGKVAVMEPRHHTVLHRTQHDTTHTSSTGPTQTPRNVPNRQEQNGLRHWLYTMEERHIAIQEKLTAAVESLSATNEGLLISLQQMAGTQVQLVNLLQKHLNPSLHPKS